MGEFYAFCFYNTHMASGVPAQYQDFFEEFSVVYHHALAEAGVGRDRATELLHTFAQRVAEQLQTPFQFEPYHPQITEPFDYYTFGIDFLRPLVNKPESTLTGQHHLRTIQAQLAAGDNVVFLANHQTEGDPQAISILLEDDFEDIGRHMIFVAGERVITDPMAVPFSKGRNLLCIYSKRYIDHPPELRATKQHHNRRTMERMGTLLAEGSKCIYVAPSGGRDRKNADGVVEVAPFDPQSVEMFVLMAQKSGRPTHFYPMALATYDFLPPPEKVQVELGEARRIRRSPIHMAVGPELDLAFEDESDRHARRAARADTAYQAVVAEYARFPL